MTKTNILGLSKTQLELFFDSIGESSFRATQVLKWIHQFGANDFVGMTNISQGLRVRLQELVEICEPKVIYQNDSRDGTRKWIIQVDGGNSVETVLIPDGKRSTLCVSSQVGCALNCSFCATGKQGFNRNLTAAEIIGQVRIAIKSFGSMHPSKPRRVTNVVLMGMGEPLLNFAAVTSAISLMLEDNAYNLSKRRVTLSTAGLVPAIDKLAEVSDVSLAISLHAANDKLRDQLVPLNRKYNIDVLIDACNRYLNRLNDKRVITMEYTMIDGINDQLDQAHELVGLLQRVPCKLNLIPFNPFSGSSYRCSPQPQIEAFQQVLKKAGIVTTIRATRGNDIDAACGQLVGQVQDRTQRTIRLASTN